jgi:serine/threonine-protein kinase
MTPEEDARGNRAAGPQGHLPARRFHIFEQLKQRNVFRVAALYVGMAYVLLEIFQLFFHLLELPQWAGRTAVLISVLGFPVALVFAWVYEITPEGLKPTAEVPHGQSIRRLTGRRLDMAIIAVLAVALAYFVVDKFWISKHVAGPQSASTAAQEMPARTNGTPSALAFAPPHHSIAVLPFVNMSGDKEQEYFSDGLTEELLNSLAKIEGLQVAGRTSSFYFKGKDVDLGTVAHKLNVGVVLEGSVRRSSNTVRITAQLINAVTGFHLWSETYDRDLGNVLKLQTEIATSVASALKVTLLGDVSAKIELGGTRTSAAFDSYLRGTKALTSYAEAKDLQTAIAEYTQAIRLDPNYALAFAGRSRAYTAYAQEFATGAAIRESFDKAQLDAREATRVAPELAEGHLALGYYFETGVDFPQAREAYELALTLAPGNAEVLRTSGSFLFLIGQFEQGISAARRAVALDPLDRRAHNTLGYGLYFARRYEEAIAALSDSINVDPNYAGTYGFRGLAHYGLADLDGARSSCETKPDHWVTQWCLAVVYDKLGRHADAEAALAKVEAEMSDASAYQYATIYAQWGNRAKALEWLESAMRLRDPGLGYLKTDPLMDPLRMEPRFQAIERKLNFPK